MSIHNSIKLITEQIDTLDLNTSISQLMIFANELNKADVIPKSTIEIFLKLLAPFAPHITEELWRYLGHADTIVYEKWPKYDIKYLIKNTVIIPIQINGKVRDKIEIDKDTSKDDILKIAREAKNIVKYLENSQIIKEIYVPIKIVNFVVR